MKANILALLLASSTQAAKLEAKSTTTVESKSEAASKEKDYFYLPFQQMLA